MNSMGNSIAFLSALALVLCGVMAAASIVVKKKPDAKKWLDKLVPYQGAIGVIVLFWAFVGLIHCFVIVGDVSDFGKIPSRFRPPIGPNWFWWITYLLSNLLGLVLGFLLGFSMINKFLAKDETPEGDEADSSGQKAAKAMYEKLIVLQIPLGLAGICVGLLAVIVSIISFPASPLCVGILLSVLMLLSGSIAASGFIVAKKPQAGDMIKKIESSQGFIGPATFFWSLMSLIYMIRLAFLMGKYASGGAWVWWVSGMLTVLAGTILGFLLGYRALSNFFLSGKEELQEKADELRAKLTFIQMPLGLAGMGLGLWFFIATLIWCT